MPETKTAGNQRDNMRIKDPLRMNDWNIYQFLGVVLALQAAVLAGLMAAQ